MLRIEAARVDGKFTFTKDAKDTKGQRDDPATVEIKIRIDTRDLDLEELGYIAGQTCIITFEPHQKRLPLGAQGSLSIYGDPESLGFHSRHSVTSQVSRGVTVVTMGCRAA
jgi:hypothetical protein